jgi:hypothetical protein
MLSKKREPAKTSVGSLSSSPDKCSEKSKATNALVEAPTGAQLPISPESAFSSAGAAHSPNVSSHHGSPRLASITGTLADEYAEDATWGIEIDEESNHNLLTASDIRNVHDYNAFSWPPYNTTDADWQFDFEVPLTAENTYASTGAISTALNELDMSPFYNRSTQSLDSTGSPRELIGFLNINEKVRSYTIFWASNAGLYTY